MVVRSLQNTDFGHLPRITRISWIVEEERTATVFGYMAATSLSLKNLIPTVVLPSRNHDLLKVSRFIRLQSTPMIVVNKMIMAPRSTIIEQERHLRSFIESWRQAWESRNLDTYMAHYSPNFQSDWLDYRGWKEKKRKLTGRYSKIRVKLGNVYFYRQDGIVTSIFTQSYSSDSFRSTGIKVLYLLPNGSKYNIYAEDYHQPVDDPFPVAPLLARAGIDPGPTPADMSDVRIRLVSTDEPDQVQQGETENPQPSAPSRGVVLDRIAQVLPKQPTTPAIQTNDKMPEERRTDRLLVVSRPTDSAPGTNSLQDVSEPEIALRRERRETFAQLQKDGNIGNGITAAVRGPISNPTTENQEKSWPTTKAASDGSTQNYGDLDKNGVNEFLIKWKSAWEQKNLDRFMKMYHPDFEQGAMKYPELMKSKKSFFRKYKTIRVDLDRMEIRKENGILAVKFVQSFQGDNYSDKGWKSMVLANDKDKGFRIISEGWAPISGPASNTGAKGPQ